ncbi:flagellar motor protein MotB [Thalassospira sp. TSL5-1]|uniref:flagellar motor protein MotB n=1 Tax=Thalassospira sp. TSL5-1 TaxID=1544451 RepID=UPI000938876A|nr:flagellar motor protein MotB [Thalassospira sp. TSL5-1]OKH90005.1 membrane protein [Thalassospira sp. TSL5-1]
MPDIVIKKVKKGGHGGHHGGSWKVAYADFVTAMMAFFLLLWLLGSSTDEQLKGISNYFAPESISQSESGAGGLLAGTKLADSGSMRSENGAPVIQMDIPPTPDATTVQNQGNGETEAEKAAKEAAANEKKEFDKAAQDLKEAMEKSPELKELSKNLLVEQTDEGLRIQIIDKDGTSMFPSGSADLRDHTRLLLKQVATAIKDMPQKIAIEGHTDAVPYSHSYGTYTNWELSADRALATRRQLQLDGLPDDRFGKVSGVADTVPFIKDDPKDERNRRISITLLRGTGKQPEKQDEEQDTNDAAPASSLFAPRDRDGNTVPPAIDPDAPVRRPTFSVPSRN